MDGRQAEAKGEDKMNESNRINFAEGFVQGTRVHFRDACPYVQ